VTANTQQQIKYFHVFLREC